MLPVATALPSLTLPHTSAVKPALNASWARFWNVAPRPLNLPVVQHAEDTRLTEGCSMHEGRTSFRLGLRGMPDVAEANIVDRDVTLAQQIRESRLHVAHLSTADALRECGKSRGANERSQFRSQQLGLKRELLLRRSFSG